MTTDLFHQRYQQLNDQQKQAVDTIEGPLLVIAGPGSGKTELLSLRVANILLTQDVQPNNILCLTYTEAGATNMRQRLAGLIGHQAYQVNINTFHGFCAEIINRYGQYFYQGALMQTADDLAKIEILHTIFSQLPYTDPLASNFQDSYTYLDDAKDAISKIKQAGLNPDDFAYLIQKNGLLLAQVQDKITAIFPDKISPKQLPAILDQALQVVGLCQALVEADQDQPNLTLGQQTNILDHLAHSLSQAIAQAQATGKTSAMTAWKNTYLAKNDQGQLVCKDLVSQDKLVSLAAIYKAYQQAMQAGGYYDFDDMVLDVLTTLAATPELKYALQEQYQYVLVDEFQDTNDAQLRLLGYITDAAVYEGRPNIMAVGDDDQAIYKFQGANLANILQFRQRYQDPSLIVLTHNYRSSQAILDLSRQVIVQGQERLESIDTDIIKQLLAQGRDKDHPHQPQLSLYQTREHEFVSVAQDIAHHLQAIGPDQAGTIAVICARRRDLEDFALHLQAQGVPYRYDRQRDVLQEPHIHQLLTMARFVCQVATHDQAEADQLLPQILSYPFWGIDRHTLWQLSVKASQATQPEQRLWLWQMEASDNPTLQAMAGWFKQLRLLSATQSVEVMLEHLIGAHTPLLPEDSDEPDWLDPDSATATAAAPTLTDQASQGFTSPVKDFYFPSVTNAAIHAQYIGFLSSLQVFVQALRNYRPGQPLLLADMLTFVDLHLSNNLRITDSSAYTTNHQAVQLMTAHGSKGLEFNSVYLLSCVKDVWLNKGRTNKISFPANLPLTAKPDDADDKLRLFFVALTRARQRLMLSAYTSDNGKEVNQLAFLADVLAGQHLSTATVPLSDPVTVLAQSWQTYHHPPLASADTAILLPLVENYQLSITHLNDFLDVSRGGPQAFLEQHLLRFPEPKSAQQAYGTAVHRALQDLFARFRQDTVLPSQQVLLDAFTKALQAERLSSTQEAEWLERGREELSLYYQSKSSQFSAQDIVERNFAQQQVMVGNACLTGKIDRIVTLSPGQVSVHDIKTGKPSSAWTGKTDYEKLKLAKYQRQLLFYKLLVERSRDYAGKLQVAQGILEFVQSLNGQFVQLPLELSGMDDQLSQLEQLIQVVYNKIVNLDFPNISAYQDQPAHKAMDAFIQDLLDGTI